MRSISRLSSTVLSCALVSATALGLTAPAAVADDGGTQSNVTSFGFSVTPSTIAAGGTVTLSSNECEVPTVHVTAPIFDNVDLNEGHSATAQVYPDAKPGAQYVVTFDCNGEKGTTTLTIATGNTSPTPNTTVHRGVKAGLGGSSTGTDPALLAAGGALIAGALGAGFLRLRKRRTDGS
ncbi:hypothetical protein AB0J38_44965 [Streptomyces sp. NPDC050095]|uniref:hypothetical protein n=1 Tax=unclassified Streptomyces TaxID=2593676 RepID=UPI003448B7C9